jgi:glyceraldehyde-3-phosphate dehydrogenase/erythrose-4-phosphate dehydrogenase
MSREKKILVVGTGTIGEPLIGLLSAYQADFGIDEVIFHKRTPLLTDRSKVRDLIRRGAKLATDADRVSSFEELEVGTPDYTTEQALEEASVVIDCTPAGNKMKEQLYNRFAHNTELFIAQGSEFGFGKMFARGINDRALIHGEDKFIQVVSCNTHNISVLIDTLALADGQDNLRQGRFVCIRRSNDLSQDTSFIPSPQVGKHSDPIFGTHHARDAYHLFKTMGLELKLFSSALKLNTQYMHVIQYHLRLNKPTDMDSLLQRIHDNDRIAVTHKNTANAVFSFGRDHGFFGRILNQTVIPTETLAVLEGGKEVVGYCFTPQDGNSILSSIAATLWALYPDSYEEKVQVLKDWYFDEV